MSEEVVDTAPEATETAPTETTTTEAPQSTKDWLASNAPEGAKTDWLNKYDSDESLAKGIYAAQQMIGKKGDIPAEGATPEEYQEFWGKLGANDMEIKAPELGEEFGDARQELGDYYGGIAEQVNAIAKEEIASATSVPDLLNKIVGRFIAEDSKMTLENQIESSKSLEDQFKAVAAKTGMTPDGLKQSNSEVINRMGWNDETTIHEIIHEFNKVTTNSKTLQEAHLNNSHEGLDAQIAQISASDVYLRETGPKHDLAVKEMNRLLTLKNGLNN